MSSNASKNIASLSLKSNLPRSFECGIFEDQNGFQTYSIFRPEFGVFDNSNMKPLTALFMSRMLYWTGKGTIARGWVLKKSEDWQSEILCSAYQVRTIAKNLEKQNILERKNGKGNVPMYRIDWGFVDERLVNMMSNDIANVSIIKVPKTPRQRQLVSLYLKGHTEFVSYTMTYATNGKSDGQIMSRAKKEFAKWGPFIKEAKKNPTEHIPKLNGKYINAPKSKQQQIKIDVPIQAEFELKPLKEKTKKKRVLQKDITKRLNQFTNYYLEIFEEINEELFNKLNPNKKYQKIGLVKIGKERTQVKHLAKYIQERLVLSDKNDYENVLEISEKDEMNALRMFLRSASKLFVNETTVNKWFLGKAFVPSLINSQKLHIYEHISSKGNKKKVSKSNLTEEGFGAILSKVNQSSF